MTVYMVSHVIMLADLQKELLPLYSGLMSRPWYQFQLHGQRDVSHDK